MHLIKKIVVMTFCLAFGPALSYGQGNGTLSKSNFTAGNCSISSMSVKYSFRSLMGEPVVNGTYSWDASYGTESDCLPYNTKIALKVSNGGSGYAYVNISPTVPDAGKGYGHNVSGSPDWDDLFCGYGSRYENNCFDESDAKSFWKNGFNVVDFEVWW